MDKKVKDYIVRAVRNATQDNLERANMAFGRLSEKELDSEYGQSGKTCREIWDEYKEERKLNELAMAEVMSL